MQAPAQTQSHHRQVGGPPSGSRMQHSHGISVHPVSFGVDHRAASPTVPQAGGHAESRGRTNNGRHRTGGSDSGSNSPDRVPEADE